MFVPHYYRNENLEDVLGFVESNSFGILISPANPRLLATHIPLELDKNEQGQPILVGHISKANPQWKGFVNDVEVLAIFNGPHSYVSSSWYDHENVPTWNYIAVHIYGKIKIMEGERLLSALRKLVDKYEQGSERPVSLDTISEKFLNKEIKGIVGFEIEITDVQAAYKLSQNRDDKNHAAIAAELRKTEDPQAHAVATEMGRYKRIKKTGE